MRKAVLPHICRCQGRSAVNFNIGLSFNSPHRSTGAPTAGYHSSSGRPVAQSTRAIGSHSSTLLPFHTQHHHYQHQRYVPPLYGASCRFSTDMPGSVAYRRVGLGLKRSPSSSREKDVRRENEAKGKDRYNVMEREASTAAAATVGDNDKISRSSVSAVAGNAQQVGDTKVKRTHSATYATLRKLRRMLHPDTMKQLARQYGSVALVLHLSVFGCTLGSMWGLLQHGVDITHIFDVLPFEIDHSLVDPKASSLAVAYGMTLITGPARTVFTITATPAIARRWWTFIGHKKALKAEKEAMELQKKKEMEEDHHLH